MHVADLHRRSVESFVDRLDALAAAGDDAWSRPTPCPAWDVRALVNHIVYEDLWTVPLMEGSTIEEVGDRFDGDVLGEDPIGSALGAARAAIASDSTVTLSPRRSSDAVIPRWASSCAAATA